MTRRLLVVIVCVISLGAPLAARAQSDGEPESGALLSVEAVVQQVRPALATIRSEGRDGSERGIGTGFVVSEEGLLATNLHVIGEGRSFSVETADGRRLKVLAVEASDHSLDLAIIRVQADADRPLTALPLSDDRPQQGMSVVAMGNPWGLKDSVVSGVVSAFREIDGREMIQLAMPIEPGNSGGPVVDRRGNVVGIVNMKSALQQNVGFALQIAALKSVLSRPNPITIDRWTTLGALDHRDWSPLFGADWRQRGGKITVSGAGQGFGGRSLCLSERELPEAPFEIAVSVKLDDETGAAGLVFHADGRHTHYGFYPSNGNLRLSCFQGPTVYSWQVLHEKPVVEYRRGDWNRLRVRVEEERILCYVNGQLAFESRDSTYRSGKVGLAKFRQTAAEFKNFRVGKELEGNTLSTAELERVETIIESLPEFTDLEPRHFESLEQAAASSVRAVLDRAREVDREASRLAAQAGQLRRLAGDLHVRLVVRELARLAEQPTIDLLRGALLISQLEDQEIHLDDYVAQVERMAQEIRDTCAEDADCSARLSALNTYLFEQNGYHGSRFEYYHRANSFLNRVIDDREGLPISLSLLYIELARRLELNVEGVGLPGHFVVRFRPLQGKPYLVDVFDQGKRLSDEDVRQLVRDYTGAELTEELLAAATSRDILTRMLRNLLGVAERESDLEAQLRFLEALIALEPDSVQFRGLRAVVRSETGRRAAAVSDLDWIIDRQPPDLDLDKLHQMREFFQRR